VLIPVRPSRRGGRNVTYFNLDIDAPLHLTVILQKKDPAFLIESQRTQRRA